MLENYSLNYLKMKIIDLLTYYRMETNCLACSVIDKDGFVIASEIKHGLNKEKYEKKLVELYNYFEFLTFFNYSDKIRSVTIETFEHSNFSINNGFTILIRRINSNLTIISVLSKYYLKDMAKQKLLKVINKISKHFKSTEKITISKDEERESYRVALSKTKKLSTH